MKKNSKETQKSRNRESGEKFEMFKTGRISDLGKLENIV